jgi:hypothetical protein
VEGCDLIVRAVQSMGGGLRQALCVRVGSTVEGVGLFLSRCCGLWLPDWTLEERTRSLYACSASLSLPVRNQLSAKHVHT